MRRNFLGRHVIAELHGCDADLLDDAEFITNILLKSARDTKVTVVDYVVRKFEPQGVSVVVIISESHITIHTWPELKYAALDFYTCGKEDPENAVREIAHALKTKNLIMVKANRGSIKKIKKVIQEINSSHDQIDATTEEKYYYIEIDREIGEPYIRELYKVKRNSGISKREKKNDIENSEDDGVKMVYRNEKDEKIQTEHLKNNSGEFERYNKSVLLAEGKQDTSSVIDEKKTKRSKLSKSDFNDGKKGTEYGRENTKGNGKEPNENGTDEVQVLL